MLWARYWVLAQDGDALGPIGSGFRTVDMRERERSVDVKSPYIAELPIVTMTHAEWNALPKAPVDENEPMGDLLTKLRHYKPKKDI